MDTISRENSSSNLLPIIGIAAGVIGVILGFVAFTKVSSVSKEVAALTGSGGKIESIETTVASHQGAIDQAKATADRAAGNANGVRSEMSAVVRQIADKISAIETDVTALKTPPPKAAKGGAAGEKGEKAEKAPVVAGPDEYIIKSGDSLAKVARAHGVSLADLQAVNPGVNSAKLKVGDKIKLPAKK
jgi:LysM repeat protein